MFFFCSDVFHVTKALFEVTDFIKTELRMVVV